jgi:membrane-associated phospholipid phosphatase
MDLTRERVAPVDRLLAAFNLMMAGVWSLAPGTPHARVLIAAHLAAAALPLLLRRTGTLSAPVAALRHAYPILWLAAFWSEVDAVRQALHPVSNDALIRALDIQLFGSALHQSFMPAASSLWISEPLHFAYFAYYAAIALPLIALGMQGRRTELQQAWFRLMLTYVVCFTLYAIFPVDGPHRTEGFYAGRPADGLVYTLVHAINESGGSTGAAFPSSHAAGAVTIAWLGWLYFSRRVAVLMSIHAAAVVVATFYTQYHYAIDSLAGLLLALSLQLVVAPMLLRRMSPRRTAAPRLPVRPRAAWLLEGDGAVP